MGWMDFKNSAETIILIGYGVTLLYKVASVESELKARIAANTARLDIALTEEAGKRAVIERDIDNCRYEVANKLTEITQMQRDIQCRVNSNYNQG
jgi:hypothetical protein